MQIPCYTGSQSDTILQGVDRPQFYARVGMQKYDTKLTPKISIMLTVPAKINKKIWSTASVPLYAVNLQENV